jgi:hypothetical protein
MSREGRVDGIGSVVDPSSPSGSAVDDVGDGIGGPNAAGCESNAPLRRDGRSRAVPRAPGGQGRAPAAPRRGASPRDDCPASFGGVGLRTGNGGPVETAGDSGRISASAARRAFIQRLAEGSIVHGRDGAASSGLACPTIRGRASALGASDLRGGQGTAARDVSVLASDALGEGSIRGRGDFAPGAIRREEAVGEPEVSEQRSAAMAEVVAFLKRSSGEIEGGRPTASQRLAALRRRVASRTAAFVPAGGGEEDRGVRGVLAELRDGQSGGAGAADRVWAQSGIVGGGPAMTTQREEADSASDCPRRTSSPRCHSAPGDATAVAPARQLKTLKCTSPPAGVVSFCNAASGGVEDRLGGQLAAGSSSSGARACDPPSDEA